MSAEPTFAAHVTDSFEDAAVFVCETAVIMKIWLQDKQALKSFKSHRWWKERSEDWSDPFSSLKG